MQYIVSIVLLMILTLGTSLAEEKTTNNLITNGNFETGNSNSWTTNGDVQVLNDCCTLNNVPSNYDLEFGDSGSIEQEFNLSTDTITQDMLNNGITLDSTVEVQNGECAVAGCWGGSGGADSFTIVLKIKDADGNVLATSTKIRTDVTGINGANFIDTLTYNGQNSNLGNLNIAGTDANAPANLGGANVDNISVTMTYDDTVISNEIIEELENVFEDLKEEIFEELEFKEEFTFNEEFTFEVVQAPEIKEELEIEQIIEELSMPEKEPEIIEEAEIVEEVIEEKPEEEVITEEIIKEAKEEMPEEIKEEAPEQMAEEKEEEIIEETNEETPTKEVKTKVASKKTKKPKIDKIMAKVDEQIKDSAKNLVIKNIIKLDAMQNDQASLVAYNNTEFYKPKDIYLNQIEIFDNRSIYANIDLVKYTANDIMEVKIKKLNEIKSKKRLLLLELQELKQ